MTKGKWTDHTNEQTFNTFGSEMIITEYKNANELTVYFPKYNWSCKSRYKEFQKGWIICPYEPRTAGIGYMGEGPFLSKINGPAVNTPEEAFYKEGKEKIIKDLADKYIDFLPDDVYIALINYEISIND